MGDMGEMMRMMGGRSMEVAEISDAEADRVVRYLRAASGRQR